MVKIILMSIATMMTVQATNASFDYVGSDGESKYYVDKDNMRYLNEEKTQRQAWFRVEAIANSDVMEKGQYMMMQNSFDCRRDLFRIDSVTTYNANKRVIKMTDDPSQWVATVPESNFDQLAHEICSK